MSSGRPRRFGDAVFKTIALVAALGVLALITLLVARLVAVAWPSLRHSGLHFVTGAVWNPNTETFGALPFIWGTLYSSFIAMLIAVPIAVGIALYLTQWAPRRARVTAELLVDLLAAVPSVVYGFWGIWVLVPLIRPLEAWLSLHVHLFGPFAPLFSGPPYGFGILAAGLLLALMILPTIAALSREVMSTVPRQQLESALALGATPWEAASLAVLRASRAGLVGAVVLGLGRALGETMAVTMVIGNQNVLSLSLLAPGQTLASAVANQFNEAGPGLYVSALVEIGLVLFAISGVVTLLARTYVVRVRTTTGRR